MFIVNEVIHYVDELKKFGWNADYDGVTYDEGHGTAVYFTVRHNADKLTVMRSVVKMRFKEHIVWFHERFDGDDSSLTCRIELDSPTARVYWDAAGLVSSLKGLGIGAEVYKCSPKGFALHMDGYKDLDTLNAELENLEYIREDYAAISTGESSSGCWLKAEAGIL
jgi:hypothetical protein